MDATFPIEVHIGLINSLSIAWSAFQALNAYIVASNYCYIHTNSLSHLLFPNPLYLSNFLVSLLFSSALSRFSYIAMVMMGLERLMVTLKSKIRSLKMKKPYDKIEKSESMRIEIRSRKAQKLIQKTLKIADSPKTKAIVF
ncbi:uncharacterized protein LOC126713968 isoform X1 [Quercus robur]|uniref:uncharacterized protein LOC126713968 isoform X1 n=1 Tax=Quercus robur TaxID=38942 RepID=UPI00216280D8|nr:uncharacterized protein LOC126713968 isoform X1 [Quercus robur]